MCYDIILCDLDGTILEDKRRHYECYKDIISCYGGRCVSIEEYWEGKRNKESRKELLRKSEFKGTENQYLKMWGENIETEKYLAYEKMRPGMCDTLSFLKRCTRLLILVTMRKNQQNLERQLCELNIKDFFDAVYCGDAGIKKRKKDLKLENAGKGILVIGDTEDDMFLAKEMEGEFIAVTDGLRDRRYLDAQYYVENLNIKNLHDVAGLTERRCGI